MRFQTKDRTRTTLTGCMLYETKKRELASRQWPSQQSYADAKTNNHYGIVRNSAPNEVWQQGSSLRPCIDGNDIEHCGQRSRQSMLNWLDLYAKSVRLIAIRSEFCNCTQ
jgi:hypothetical protein